MRAHKYLFLKVLENSEKGFMRFVKNDAMHTLFHQLKIVADQLQTSLEFGGVNFSRHCAIQKSKRALTAVCVVDVTLYATFYFAIFAPSRKNIYKNYKYKHTCSSLPDCSNIVGTYTR